MPALVTGVDTNSRLSFPADMPVASCHAPSGRGGGGLHESHCAVFARLHIVPTLALNETTTHKQKEKFSVGIPLYCWCSRKNSFVIVVVDTRTAPTPAVP